MIVVNGWMRRRKLSGNIGGVRMPGGLLACVLRGLAQRFEMSGPHQKRQIVIRPAENGRRLFHAYACRTNPMILFVCDHFSFSSSIGLMAFRKSFSGAPIRDDPPGLHLHMPSPPDETACIASNPPSSCRSHQFATLPGSFSLPIFLSKS